MPISHLRRTVGAAAVVAGSLALFGAPAGAQTCYPPTAGCVTTSSSVVAGPTLSLSSTVVARGQQVAASVTGFKAGTSGIITIASVEQQIGAFTMPASGAASTTITIPTSISLGAHTVFARGTALDGTAAAASQGVTVVAQGAGGTTTTSTGGSSLARTGAVVIPTALVGIGLVMGGLALKRSSRRSKPNITP